MTTRAQREEDGRPAAFSAKLIVENQALWDAMQTHHFVRQIADGSLPGAVFDRYLVYEGTFVATAVRILAYALAKAPLVEDQIWLNGVLSALLGEQFDYFEKAYAERGIDPTSVDRSIRGFAAFDREMLAIARDGRFADIVTVMYCAEWMYFCWCKTALSATPEPGLPREWIALHTGAAFERQALWLKQRIDNLALSMEEEERRRITALFGRVVQMEIDFHTAAFG